MIEQDEDGEFVAECPTLPGCISQGKTRAEALKNVKNHPSQMGGMKGIALKPYRTIEVVFEHAQKYTTYDNILWALSTG